MLFGVIVLGGTVFASTIEVSWGSRAALPS